MWPNEIYPEIVELLCGTAYKTAKNVVDKIDPSIGRSDEPGLSKYSVDQFINKAEEEDWTINRYYGSDLTLVPPFGKSYAPNVSELYLAIVGAFASDTNPWYIKFAIETRDSIKDWFDEWTSTNIGKRNPVALPLAIILFRDMLGIELDFEEGGDINVKGEYEAVLNGQYGSINDELYNEVFLLRTGYLKDNDDYDELEDTEIPKRLEEGKPYLAVLFYLHKGNGAYISGDYINGFQFAGRADIYCNSLEGEEKRIFEYPVKALMINVMDGLNSKDYGDIDIFADYRQDIPKTWRGWEPILSGKRAYGLSILSDEAQKAEDTVGFSNTEAIFTNDLIKLAFWVSRSGFYQLRNDVIDIGKGVFITLLMKFKETEFYQNALWFSVLRGDKKAIKAISRDFFVWEKSNKLNEFVEWLYNSRKDGQALRGALAFFNECAFVIPEKFIEHALLIAKEGLDRGYSFASNLDWGRPSVKLLSNIVKLKNEQFSGRAFEILNGEFWKAYQAESEPTKSPIRIPVIRKEIYKYWTDALGYVADESDIIEGIINKFEGISDKTVSDLFINDLHLRPGPWYKLLCRKEASHLLDKTIRLWREGNKDLVDEKWLRYYPFAEKLTEDEWNDIYTQTYNQLVEQTALEVKSDNDIVKLHGTIPPPNHFDSLAPILWRCDTDQRNRLLNGIGEWLKATSNADQVYDTVFSVLGYLVNDESFSILTSIESDRFDEAVRFWADRQWKLPPKYRGSMRRAIPSPALFRFNYSIVSYLRGDIVDPDILSKLPFDEFFNPERNLSIDAGVSIGISLGLLSRETEDDNLSDRCIDILHSLTNFHKSKVTEQAIYSLMMANNGLYGNKSKRILKELIENEDNFKRPVRYQIAIKYASDKTIF